MIAKLLTTKYEYQNIVCIHYRSMVAMVDLGQQLIGLVNERILRSHSKSILYLLAYVVNSNMLTWTTQNNGHTLRALIRRKQITL